MKVRNETDIISYVDLRSGEEYYEYGIMRGFKGWKKAQKVNRKPWLTPRMES